VLTWFLNTGHKLAGIVIFLTQLLVHWEDILDRFSSFLGIKRFYERRSNQVEKYLRLIPLLEKLASDLEAAAQSPQDAAVVADIKALIADISSGTPPTTAV
jgi:hypothetical protein